MVVPLGIDGTIHRHPEFFAHLSESLISAGHRIVVITFRENEAETAAVLDAWGVRYHEQIVNDLDEQLSVGVLEWKGVVCTRLGVDVFFEDDTEVLAHAPPSVVCFSPFLR
ncbi:MAG: hypothetical protein EA423_10905 [Phycisphaerales bacterium]|nr:MAG: hypothetical protein EA423_10905 [Phycisphaerales bacterium]